METKEIFDENSLKKLNSILSRGNIEEILNFLISTNWKLSELKIDNTEERIAYVDENGKKRDKPRNVIVFTNTLITKSGEQYIYEFKIHEEHKIEREYEKFTSDKEWTCQITRIKKFSDNDLNLTLSNIHEILNKLLSIISALTYNNCELSRDINASNPHITLNDYLNRWKTQTDKNRIYKDSYTKCRYSLRDLLTNEDNNILDIHKYLNFIYNKKNDTHEFYNVIEYFLNDIRLKELEYTNNLKILTLLKELKNGLINLQEQLASISVQYLDNTGNWVTNRNSAETHHVIKHPDFKTTGGMKYTHPENIFFQKLYKENRKFIIRNIIIYITYSLLEQFKDIPPEEILKSIKSYQDSSDNVWQNTTLSNLSKLYKADNLLIEQILCQKLIQSDYTLSPEEYLCRLQFLQESLSTNSPFFNAINSLLNNNEIESHTLTQLHRNDKFFNQLMHLILNQRSGNIPSPDKIIQQQISQISEKDEKK